MAHAFWYAAAAALGCVGYGSVFLAIGLYVRNPILPAAVLLAWEGAAGILPHALQKISILYYLQSLCPVPAPMDDDAPTLIRLLAAPAATRHASGFTPSLCSARIVTSLHPDRARPPRISMPIEFLQRRGGQAEEGFKGGASLIVPLTGALINVPFDPPCPVRIAAPDH